MIQLLSYDEETREFESNISLSNFGARDESSLPDFSAKLSETSSPIEQKPAPASNTHSSSTNRRILEDQKDRKNSRNSLGNANGAPILRIAKRVVTPTVVDIYNYNFGEMMSRLRSDLVEYTVISMDTEFPGFVYTSSNPTRAQVYQTVKQNVDCLQLIQVGISLSTPRGARCPRVYQFNLRFNLDLESYSPPSIQLLMDSGLDFASLAAYGISHLDFANGLQWLGVLNNPFYTFVAFDGKYDFAYLVKLLTGALLPADSATFMQYVRYFFPCILDLKVVSHAMLKFTGGLSSLDNVLGNASLGVYHQAGYDALVTTNCFNSMLKRESSADKWRNFNCKLYNLN